MINRTSKKFSRSKLSRNTSKNHQKWSIWVQSGGSGFCRIHLQKNSDFIKFSETCFSDVFHTSQWKKVFLEVARVIILTSEILSRSKLERNTAECIKKISFVAASHTKKVRFLQVVKVGNTSIFCLI